MAESDLGAGQAPCFMGLVKNENVGPHSNRKMLSFLLQFLLSCYGIFPLLFNALLTWAQGYFQVE